MNEWKQPSNEWKEWTFQWMKGINPPMNERNQPSNKWLESTLYWIKQVRLVPHKLPLPPTKLKKLNDADRLTDWPTNDRPSYRAAQWQLKRHIGIRLSCCHWIKLSKRLQQIHLTCSVGLEVSAPSLCPLCTIPTLLIYPLYEIG